LLTAHENPKNRLPSREAVEFFIRELLGVLLPQLAVAGPYSSAREIEAILAMLHVRLEDLLGNFPSKDGEEEPHRQHNEMVAQEFFAGLPQLREALLLDAAAVEAGDPAAESQDEVIAAYPGFYAIAVYRIAHELARRGVSVLPRLMTEYAHRITGVDIHPEATIGESFCIDHATGVVIGQTTVIGRGVKVYQGVTLGALSVSRKLRHQRRHPQVGDGVVIYANATILGGDTAIGEHSVIGGGAWITSSVPPRSVVYNRSKVVVRGEDAPPDFIA
jgi:serine O-acetyltransferase